MWVEEEEDVLVFMMMNVGLQMFFAVVAAEARPVLLALFYFLVCGRSCRSLQTAFTCFSLLFSPSSLLFRVLSLCLSLSPPPSPLSLFLFLFLPSLHASSIDMYNNDVGQESALNS